MWWAISRPPLPSFQQTCCPSVSALSALVTASVSCLKPQKLCSHLLSLVSLNCIFPSLWHLVVIHAIQTQFPNNTAFYLKQSGQLTLIFCSGVQSPLNPFKTLMNYLRLWESQSTNMSNPLWVLASGRPTLVPLPVPPRALLSGISPFHYPGHS